MKGTKYFCLSVMQPDKETIEAYVRIIIDSIEAIFTYLKGRTKEEFIADEPLHDACLMRLIVIGEYAAKMPEKVQQQNPEVEWKEIKAARNFYVHVYLAVGWDKIWETIQQRLPRLREKMAKLSLENI